MEPGAILTTPAAHVRAAIDAAFLAAAATEGEAAAAGQILADSVEHVAAKLLPKGAGAVFSFELTGGRPAGSAFIEALQLFSHLANVGDAKSLVIHPASTTHSRMDDDALVAAGIAPGLVRLSVGLENSKDLLADLQQALKRAARVS